MPSSLVYIFTCIVLLAVLHDAGAVHTHYALVFPSQKGHPPNSSNTVYINGDPRTKVTINSPLYNVSHVKTLDKDGLAFEVLDFANIVFNEINNSAVLLDADDDVTVHVINEQSSIHGSYLSYPVNESSKYFIVPSGGEKCTIAIAALHDDTEVEIAFYSQDGAVKQHIECTQLNRSGVYQSNLCKEPTVGFIEVMTSQPVSVFNGKVCSPSCGENWEQLPPVATWGHHFILTSVSQDDETNDFRALAAFNDTTITHGSDRFNLSKGESIPITIERNSRDLYIEASNPILVYQTSYNDSSSGYRELFMVVPPIEQYSTHFPIWFVGDDKSSNRVTIILQKDKTRLLRYDDRSVRNIDWIDVPDTQYSIGTMSVSKGVHTFRTRKLDAFMAIQYSDTGSGVYSAAVNMAYNIITDIDVITNSSKCSEHISILTTPGSPFETTSMPNGTAHPDVTLEPETNVTGASIHTSSDKVYTVWIVIAVVIILCLIIVIIAAFVVIKMKSKRRDDKKVLFEKEENGSSVKIPESTVEHPYEPVCAKSQSAPLTKS